MSGAYDTADHLAVIRTLFRHNLCGGKVEAIPEEIRKKYWDVAVVSRF